MDHSRASTRAYGPGAGHARQPSAGAHTPGASRDRLDQPQPLQPQSQETPPRAHRAAPRKPKVQKRTSVGPWDFVKSVGAGSMGQVKLAMNRYTRQTAAVKIVPKAFTQKSSGESNETRDARVVREAALGKIILHPNIAQLYEVYSMTSHYYLVFEYISGGQLLDYIITHGSVSEIQARKFAREIASALDYCHRNSIVHRDLKIENILISDKGTIKIIDFGLSNLFRRDELLKTFCGSLYFAAPELLNAQPYLGPEIDVWSFGVVLYVLVCGKVPFEDKSMSALHAKIKRGAIEFPHWLSPLCTDLLKRMLVVPSAERASLREILHHPWLNKGYDEIPSAHVPQRTPLSLPLDERVVDEMAHMHLGDAAAISAELELVLSSHAYADAVRHQGDSYRHADPLNSFHPLISLYFLTRERMERMGKLDAASTGGASGGSTAAAITSSGTPGTPSTHGTGPPSTGTPSHRTPLQIQTQFPPQGSATPSTPRTPQMLQMPGGSPSTPVPQITVEEHLPRATLSPAAAPATRMRSRTIDSRPMLDVGTDAQGAQGPQGPAGLGISDDSSRGLTALFRHISIRKRSDSRSRTNSPAPPRNRNRSATTAQPPPLLTVEAPGGAGGLSAGAGAPSASRKGAHSRAKSTSHTAHAALSHADTPSTPGSAQRPGIPEVPDMPSIMAPKQVFFRGFFSVQSTTSRPLVQIRSDIIAVLTDLGIEFVEIKGGFSCIHGHTAQGALGTPSSAERTGGAGAGHLHASPRPRRLAHARQVSMGTPISSPRRDNNSDSNYSSSSESFEMDGSDMLGHVDSNMHAPVRFEIAIVKVPVLSLHGVQFKRIAGNAWQYKTIAQEILERLHL